MSTHKGHRIVSIAPGSIAEELGLEVGDKLIAIDDHPIRDRIDYEMLCAEESIRLTALDHRSDQTVECDIDKYAAEDLGIAFDDYLMSPQRSCANQCPFCFVDQLPQGMRSTLYVKDDDWRMSFLAGNFVTLTNVPDRELARIIERRVSPLFVSVQATDPALRSTLLGNPRAGRIMDQLRALADAGLRFHAQFVLCAGLNDGPALDRSLEDLLTLVPAPISAAVVPVGLTRHRANPQALKPYDRESASALLDQIERWQARCLRDIQSAFVHAADEFYVLAHRPVPDAARYEGFPQIENGVGMLRLFTDELNEAIEERVVPPLTAKGRRICIATGQSAAPWLREMAQRASAYTGATIDVLAIDNDFFGYTVTVAGLLTGRDLQNALQDVTDADVILIPDSTLKEDDDVFLDGMPLDALKQRLRIPLEAVPTHGADFLHAIAAIAGD